MAVVGLLCAGVASSPVEPDRQAVLVVVGAAGTEEYGAQFKAWAEKWREDAVSGGADFWALGLEEPGEQSDRDALEKKLSELTASSSTAAWLVFIGHGTYGAQEAKFNLRGPDVTAAELGADR